eukprot:5230576-Prymnesium_polylepis.1
MARPRPKVSAAAAPRALPHAAPARRGRSSTASTTGGASVAAAAAASLAAAERRWRQRQQHRSPSGRPVSARHPWPPWPLWPIHARGTRSRHGPRCPPCPRPAPATRRRTRGARMSARQHEGQGARRRMRGER